MSTRPAIGKIAATLDGIGGWVRRYTGSPEDLSPTLPNMDEWAGRWVGRDSGEWYLHTVLGR